MRYAILVTQDCNLRCKYCYVVKQPRAMPLSVAAAVVDFAYANTPADEPVEIGFFGGEPLLEFDRVRNIARLIQDHERYDPGRVNLSLVTNGTLLPPGLFDFVRDLDVNFVVSCDGPPDLHDRQRVFPDGRGTGRDVAATIRTAAAALPTVPVNAVYAPDSLERLPATVAYLASLGVRQIHLNADISAAWSPADADRLTAVYDEIGQWYIDRYLEGNPHYVSLLDVKIAVILRGGYQPLERCRMGRGEFAFTPDGGIYPCERLVGDGGPQHRIGHIDTGVDLQARPCRQAGTAALPPTCVTCGVREYCMNWCGCTNYMSTGSYGTPSAFLCASERTALTAAHRIIGVLERQLGPTFFDHVVGAPTANSLSPDADPERRCPHGSLTDA